MSAAEQFSLSDDYYLEIINSIRENLQGGIYPPVFTKRKYKHSHLNSYAYALDINVSDPEETIWIPGCVCNPNADKSIYLPKDLISRLKMDLNFLGFSCRKDDGKNLREGEWRIAIYSEPTYYKYPIDYYFCRQDSDGSWSIKKSWNDKVRRIHKKSDIPPFLAKYNLGLETVLIISRK